MVRLYLVTFWTGVFVALGKTLWKINYKNLYSNQRHPIRARSRTWHAKNTFHVLQVAEALAPLDFEARVSTIDGSIDKSIGDRWMLTLKHWSIKKKKQRDPRQNSVWFFLSTSRLDCLSAPQHEITCIASLTACFNLRSSRARRGLFRVRRLSGLPRVCWWLRTAGQLVCRLRATATNQSCRWRRVRKKQTIHRSFLCFPGNFLTRLSFSVIFQIYWINLDMIEAWDGESSWLGAEHHGLWVRSIIPAALSKK